MATRCLLVVAFTFGLLLAVQPARRLARAAEPSTKTAAPTHVIVSQTPYYKTSPAQDRPADGDFSAGTRVSVLRRAGSYVLVTTHTGIRAYIATNAIRPIDQGPKGEERAMPAVVNGSNQFATDLYAQLKDKTSGNLFFSPYSVSVALAMTYAGATGETRKEMAETLHFSVPDQELNEVMARLRESLLADKGKGYQLQVANRLWGQKGYEFLPDFLQTTRKYYGAELGVLDFAHDAEAARQEINRWVEKQTADKIKDLIPSGVIDPLTRLVLTNAIYFKGNWQEKFNKAATKDAPFHVSSDKEVSVPMMQQTKSFGYRAVEGLQVLEMPYAKGELSMLILLPKEMDGLPQMEKKLSPANLQNWTKELRRQKVIVFVPRFTMASQFGLKDTLQAMGMKLAFDQRKADFSRMSRMKGTNEGDLYITAVVHKAFVDVNEEGTEAAAATGVIMAPRSAPLRPEQPPVFRADHPFLFLIRDNQTGAILFMGRVSDPKDIGPGSTP